jgi:tetratricopeptide (TPR) repeat protein
LDDQGQDLQELEEPPADDLELAWENLDVARLILSKESDTKSILQLADVYLSLGDVSLESENFEQATLDYQTALDLKMKHYPNGWRELAEIHFKLALSLELSELYEQAIDHVHSAMDSIKKRIEQVQEQVVEQKERVSEVQEEQSKVVQEASLAPQENADKEVQEQAEREQVEQNDKNLPIVPPDALKVEVEELKGFLIEMESKLTDLQFLIEKEDQGEQILAQTQPSSLPINDISNLVKKASSPKKRKQVVSEQEGDKKVKL